MFQLTKPFSSQRSPVWRKPIERRFHGYIQYMGRGSFFCGVDRMTEMLYMCASLFSSGQPSDESPSAQSLPWGRE